MNHTPKINRLYKDTTEISCKGVSIWTLLHLLIIFTHVITITRFLAFQNKIRLSLSQAVSKLDNATTEDAIYEADIANDMRELELRLQEELEEWSGDDSPK